MTASLRAVEWFRRGVGGRLRVRRTTVLMAVAFVGLGMLYLEVRSEPTDVQPVLPIFYEPTTTTDAERRADAAPAVHPDQVGTEQADRTRVEP